MGMMCAAFRRETPLARKRRRARAYFADLSWVLRQRVQTSAFTSLPFSRIVNG